MDFAAIKQAYAALPFEATVTPFIDRMDEAYAGADLVLCRAGAMTLAELTVFGKAAILVPYPYAIYDHQRSNAESLQERGAAEMIFDQELTGEILAERDSRLFRGSVAARTHGGGGARLGPAGCGGAHRRRLLRFGAGVEASGRSSYMLQKKHKIHFVGIGGIGMSGIAEVLLNPGYAVTGSDLQDSEATRRLSALGAQIFVGHEEENIAGNPSVVVISTAVKYSNPEVMEARRRHIPVIPRGGNAG